MAKLLGILLGVAALVALSHCYEVPEPDCGFVCGAGGDCPSDYHCAADHRCHKNGTPESLVCTVDAALPPDARPDAPPDARPDAPPDAPPDAAPDARPDAPPDAM